MRLEFPSLLLCSFVFSHLSLSVAPSLISELRAEKIEQKSITLVWREPSYPNSSRTEYEVKYYEKVNILLYHHLSCHYSCLLLLCSVISMPLIKLAYTYILIWILYGLAMIAYHILKAVQWIHANILTVICIFGYWQIANCHQVLTFEWMWHNKIKGEMPDGEINLT